MSDNLYCVISNSDNISVHRKVYPGLTCSVVEIYLGETSDVCRFLGTDMCVCHKKYRSCSTEDIPEICELAFNGLIRRMRGHAT